MSYQSKLANPEVKPHIWWEKHFKEWVYDYWHDDDLDDDANHLCHHLDKHSSPLGNNSLEKQE